MSRIEFVILTIPSQHPVVPCFGLAHVPELSIEDKGSGFANELDSEFFGVKISVLDEAGGEREIEAAVYRSECEST